jgi:hypothetical protein
MSGDFSQAAARLRALAARMRAYADDTSLDIFRRQFEHAASELEETAIDLESRPPPRRKRLTG